MGIIAFPFFVGGGGLMSFSFFMFERISKVQKKVKEVRRLDMIRK
jgi:hypothetical protein